MKIVVLERDSVGTDISVDCLEQYGEVTFYRNTVRHQVAERIKDADIIINNKAPLDRETLKDAPNVKLICEFATGYDNVDIDYCKERGIKVANARNYSTAAVAQHTFALLFYLLEHLPHYDWYVKGGSYGAQDRFSNFDKPFVELDGKTWGIVGMGNIGKAVAKIAKAFGCRVIFYSPTGKSTCTEYEKVPFEALLRESDFLSLHCPLSDLTRHLIDEEALLKMKKTAILLNVARGGVVDTKALAKMLNDGKIQAAGLDVLEAEPIAADDPLGEIKESDKLFITPHMAWASTEARERIVEETCKNLEAFFNGEDRNIVNL